MSKVTARRQQSDYVCRNQVFVSLDNTKSCGETSQYAFMDLSLFDPQGFAIVDGMEFDIDILLMAQRGH